MVERAAQTEAAALRGVAEPPVAAPPGWAALVAEDEGSESPAEVEVACEEKGMWVDLKPEVAVTAEGATAAGAGAKAARMVGRESTRTQKQTG